MSLFNGRHGPMHPVEHLAFWKSLCAGRDDGRIREMADCYDSLVAGDAVRKKQLDELLSWATAEARDDEAFNAQED